MRRLEKPTGETQPERSSLLWMSLSIHELPVRDICERRELLSAMFDKHGYVLHSAYLTAHILPLYPVRWYLVAFLDMHMLELGGCVLNGRNI